MAEIAETRAVLDHPAARCLHEGAWQALRLHEVAALMDSGALVVDACRHGLHAGAVWLSLVSRPILFTLLRNMAEAWPSDVARDTLIARAFRIRHVDETHRARLRVEMGRLRALAELEAAGRVRASGQARSRRWLAPPLTGFTTILLLPAALSPG